MDMANVTAYISELQERSRRIRERIDANRTPEERAQIAKRKDVEATLNREDRQATYEREVFVRFATSDYARRELGIALDTVESRRPPYPDIQCRCKSGAHLFELASITGSEAAKAARSQPGQPRAFALSHELPFLRMLEEKLKKSYQTDGLRLDLVLFYWQQPPPPQELLNSMVVTHSRPLQALLDLHFSRIWIFDCWGAHVLSLISNHLPHPGQ